MNLAILGLSSGFILVLVFLYYLIIKTDLRLSLKFLSVFVVTGFYIIQYESLQQITGWPSTDALPEKFVLLATEVHEPNQKEGEKGVMYWWVRDSVNEVKPPRVYQLPYQPEVYKKTEQVIEEQKRGSQYIGRTIKSDSSNIAEGVNFEKISKSDRYKK